MEISKGLQQEIQLVQSKLKNAIRDHQICVGKLKDDPENADVLGRIQEIQLHIVSLGRCQKQVVQRLRKEVEAFKADNANDVKVSFASLLGLNNNNHITANNEATTDEISEVKVVTNGLDSGRHAKEDYEEIVRNGDVTTPPRENLRNKQRSVSVETLSAEDEIMEVEVDDNSRETGRPNSEERLEERNVNFTAQLDFLEILGLITTSRFTDLQNKRAERKRRSTANPQFVYSNWEIPTKRKRHNYLQSAGNVPQTRQTTARLNGPSPPPSTNNKTATTVVPPKSTSPPTRTIAKSLIPTQKATTRPNILRNMSESRVFVNKGRIENGNSQVQLSSSVKGSQQSNSKTVHIPGLPSGLTIERIENDSAVCINCRNPGTLTNCDNCEANYHVSCHTISPPPPRLCPKCAVRLKDGVSTTTIKKNDELVAASYAPGVAGKAGEDPEIDKASCGLYKIGAAAKHQQQIVGTGGCSVNQLPSSTFLIPISPNPVAPSNSFNKSDFVVDEQSLEIVKSDSNSNTAPIADGNELSFNTTLVIGNQFSRSSVTYVPQPDPLIPYAYQLPFNSPEISNQPYCVVKKIAESGKQTEQTTEAKCQQLATSSGNIDSHGGCDVGSGGGGKPFGGEAGLQLDKLTGRLAESIARGSKKSATRAIPGLNRIVHADNKSIAFPSEYANDNEIDKLSSNGSHNVGNSTNGEPQRSVAIGGTEALGCSREIAKSSEKFEASKQSEHRPKSVSSRDKRKSDSGGHNAMLAGYNKSDTVADCSDNPRKRKGRAAATRLNENNDDDECELSRDGSRDKHKSQPAPLLHALFAGYNKSDNITDRSNELKQREGHGNAGQFAKSNDNESEPSRDESKAQLSRCSVVSGSTEHVKLEEAHLSAPLRAKLVRDDAKMIVESKESIGRTRTTTRMLSNRRRTTEDRRRTPPLQRALETSNNKISKHENNRQLPRILMRPARKSLESRDAVNNENSLTNTSKLQDTLDFASFEKKYSNAFVKIVPGMNTLPEVVSTDTSSTDTDEEESSLTSATDGILRGTDVKDKAEDIESKDLISEERDTDAISEEREQVNTDGDVDEEIDDEEEDLEDSPILDEDITADRINDRCNISTVSPESMKVLEQFESAILDADSGDITANP